MTCTVCDARTQTFLCRTHETELAELLDNLAIGLPIDRGRRSRPWLDCLRDAALGDTRLGESARRSTDYTTPVPFHHNASTRLDAIHATLVRWVQETCETQGIQYTGARTHPADFIGPLPDNAVRGHATSTTKDAVIWLRHQIGHITLTEDAGFFYREIRDIHDAIERIINRPKPNRFLGPCPAQINDPGQCRTKEPHHHPHACATEITAELEAGTAQCPACGAEHDVEYLQELLRNDLAYLPMSSVELLGSRTSETPGVLEQLEIPVPRSTFHYWRKERILRPRAWRCRDGSVWAERQTEDDEPLYWLADVRELRDGSRELAG